MRSIVTAVLLLLTGVLCAEEAVLYYTPSCPYSKRVLKYLNKIHKTMPLKNLKADPLAKEELRQLGGRLEVPCLIVDGKAVYSATEIIQWIASHKDKLRNDE